jgi:hypothetical protein
VVGIEDSVVGNRVSEGGFVDSEDGIAVSEEGFWIPMGILACPGRELQIPGRKLLSPRQVTGINSRKSNKGAGVPFYDSSASYDSGCCTMTRLRRNLTGEECPRLNWV